jgi:hypothetical protein
VATRASGHELAQPLGHAVDRLDPVVQEEDLPLAHQLAADRGADLLLVVRARRRSAPGAAPPAA